MSLGRPAVTDPNQTVKATIALGCPVPEAGISNVPVNQLLNCSGFHPGEELPQNKFVCLSTTRLKMYIHSEVNSQVGQILMAQVGQNR